MVIYVKLQICAPNEPLATHPHPLILFEFKALCDAVDRPVARLGTKSRDE
jgi:hypothetical protein